MAFQCKEGHFTDKEHEGKECPYDSKNDFTNLTKKFPQETFTKEEIEKIYGNEFKGFVGQEAINKLLKEKQGHVKAAFFRKDIGKIDLLWGNEKLGLRHIIQRREGQGIDVNDFLSDLAKCIENGKFRRKNDRGNFEFIHNGKIAIISPELLGNKITFLLTAFKTHSKK